ncbi:hypothetical protein F0562_012460 [Nyssa sinensis]|uniref:peroxidase n=1 Tax=Nyssa sinensis TaxID=561372 RepID=A0A5J4ZXL2_9ASTE|nr:hypothetical protein F0562_012460 [Nyssa sinensis]
MFVMLYGAVLVAEILVQWHTYLVNLTVQVKIKVGGSSKTLVIVNICPNVSNLSETVSSLNFSARARNAILSLRNREVDAAKSALEKKCPGVVSCADILALVARDAVSQVSGPSWNVPLGRRDGRVSKATQALADLPSPFGNITELKATFSSKGLSAKDLATKYIEYDTSFGEEEKTQAKALKVTCNLNDAAWKLKLKDYKQAEKLCTKGSNLFMGYIGDSRAILGSKDSNDSMVAIQLTVDLKPDLPTSSTTPPPPSLFCPLFLNLQTHGLQQAYPGFEQMAGSVSNQTTGVYPPYPSGSSAAAPNFQVNVQLPHLVTTPTLIGKGAKQWRDGDWICTNCNNHNYASRSECNRSVY